ncbi:hypothetical protein NQZ68_039955 [Dissostichus eleginoides]|nr:hypothetical protein NQZ68_039955 [Dissostichus eleginoides]
MDHSDMFSLMRLKFCFASASAKLYIFHRISQANLFYLSMATVSSGAGGSSCACLDIMRIHRSLELRKLMQLNQSLMIILITLFRENRKPEREEREEGESGRESGKGGKAEEKRMCAVK